MPRLPRPGGILGPDRSPRLRRIRSFVRREGRLTRAQARAIDAFWPRYGLSTDAPFEARAVFGREAPLTLEIGFGDGANLLALARDRPEEDFLGIDVYRPGIGALLARLGEGAIGNVRLFATDACEVLERCFPQPVLTRVLIFFPDPWPKRRHHKRRLIQPAFLDQLAHALLPGGTLHLATDDADYAASMETALGAVPAYRRRSMVVNQGSPLRVRTRFEARGQRLGHPIYDIEAERIPPPGAGSG